MYMNQVLTVVFTYIFQVTVPPLVDIHASDGVVKYVNL